MTRARVLDLWVFAGMLAWMSSFAPQLPVYYTVTPTRVSLVAVGTDGSRTPLETPRPLARVGRSPERTRQHVERFARSEEGLRIVPPGGRLEWTIHFAKDSLRFDRTTSFETPPR